MKPLYLLPLILALTGCQWLGVWPSTSCEIEFDPVTKTLVADLDRAWLAGPVDMDAHYTHTYPDGESIIASVDWQSDVNLDPAQFAFARQMATVDKGVDLAWTLAQAYLKSQGSGGG